MTSQPTPAQARMVEDFQAQGNRAQVRFSDNSQPFVVLPMFEVTSGRFAGRTVDLAVEVQPDGGVGSALHVQADPNLLALGQPDQQTNGYNVIQSTLGAGWQYWSFNLMAAWPSRRAVDLIPIFNGVLERA